MNIALRYRARCWVLLFTVSSISFAQDWNARISVQPLQLHAEEETDYSGVQGSIGYVPAELLSPGFHLYATFTKYHHHRIWMTSNINKIDAIGIFPVVNVARLLIAGYGYSFGTQHKLDTTNQDTVSFYDGKYSSWGPFGGVDVDIYVYEGFYLNVGLYFKKPANYLALGLSKQW